MPQSRRYTKIDAVYWILRSFQVSRKKTDSLKMVPIKQTRYYEFFDMLVIRGFLKKMEISKGQRDEGGNKGYQLYKITNKGEDFIICYDSMVNYKEKLKIFLQEI